MSRIGKQPIDIPEKVDVSVNGNVVTVKGDKGELTLDLHAFVNVEVADNVVTVTVAKPENKDQAAMWGTFTSLIGNMIEGVTEGFKKQLEINGVGYGFQVSGKKLTVKAGYSHPVERELPEGVEATVEGNVLTLESADKQLVGQFAAELRSIRKPEPYKGTGIKYIDEQIRRKAGKQAGAE